MHIAGDLAQLVCADVIPNRLGITGASNRKVSIELKRAGLTIDRMGTHDPARECIRIYLTNAYVQFRAIGSPKCSSGLGKSSSKYQQRQQQSIKLTVWPSIPSSGQIVQVPFGGAWR